MTTILQMRYKTETDAKQSAERFQKCPKIHFWGNNGKAAFVVLKVPDDNRIWSDYIAGNPEKSFGGFEAELTYLDRVFTPGDIQVSYDKIKGDISPCGIKCKPCPSFGPCSGCPALIFDDTR